MWPEEYMSNARAEDAVLDSTSFGEKVVDVPFCPLDDEDGQNELSC
jgi:hypothetical protein